MSLTAIREQIKTILSGVSGIGVVHDYERFSNDWKKYLSLFTVEDDNGEKRINGCTFTRVATPEKWLTNVEYLRVYEFDFHGIYSLKDSDATELVFQSTIENVCDAFRAKPTLNGTCETITPEFGALSGRSGMQVETIENRKFGVTLAHYFKLRLGAQTTETR